MIFDLEAIGAQNNLINSITNTLNILKLQRAIKHIKLVYACFFGWPNLTNTGTGGFLGMTGNNIRSDMRVVDLYRREGDKLAEN